MINTKSYTTPSHLQGSSKGTGFNHVFIESFINTPPDIFEYFGEVCGSLRRCRHSTTKSRIDMVVATAKRAGNKTAFAVYYPVAVLAFAC